MESGELDSILDQHERWRGQECINLIASENITSQRVRKFLASEMGHRYTSNDQFYHGTKFLDEVERFGEEVAKQVFNASFANLRPLSGHAADMILVSAYVRQNEKVMSVNPSCGGYPGISEEGYGRILGAQNQYFVFDKNQLNIRVAESAKLIESSKPKLVVFGSSFIIFPHPIKELTHACHQVGSKIAYDASHVLGLIAGSQFQDPLREGADLMVGSTHKSLFGPQGGIILGNNPEDADRIAKTAFPGIVDNAHWNRIAALAQALLEIREFGKDYAHQVVSNAQALAKALDQNGVEVLGRELGYTRSHQVILKGGLIDGKPDMGWKLASRLESANIITDAGIRLGTCEVTRRGMKESEMNRIAEFISRLLLKKEDPRRIKPEVLKLRKEFDEISFA